MPTLLDVLTGNRETLAEELWRKCGGPGSRRPGPCPSAVKPEPKPDVATRPEVPLVPLVPLPDGMDLGECFNNQTVKEKGKNGKTFSRSDFDDGKHIWVVATSGEVIVGDGNYSPLYYSSLDKETLDKFQIVAKKFSEEYKNTDGIVRMFTSVQSGYGGGSKMIKTTLSGFQNALKKVPKGSAVASISFLRKRKTVIG